MSKPVFVPVHILPKSSANTKYGLSELRPFLLENCTHVSPLYLKIPPPIEPIDMLL